MRPSAWQQRVGLTTVNYSSSASHLATALLDPCMLLFLPVARLTPARPLKYQYPVARHTTERPHQCPMPPCCKAHRCKASSVPYASLLQGLLPGPYYGLVIDSITIDSITYGNGIGNAHNNPLNTPHC